MWGIFNDTAFSVIARDESYGGVKQDACRNADEAKGLKRANIKFNGNNCKINNNNNNVNDKTNVNLANSRSFTNGAASGGNSSGTKNNGNSIRNSINSKKIDTASNTDKAKTHARNVKSLPVTENSGQIYKRGSSNLHDTKSLNNENKNRSNLRKNLKDDPDALKNNRDALAAAEASSFFLRICTYSQNHEIIPTLFMQRWLTKLKHFPALSSRLKEDKQALTLALMQQTSDPSSDQPGDESTQTHNTAHKQSPQQSHPQDLQQQTKKLQCQTNRRKGDRDQAHLSKQQLINQRDQQQLHKQNAKVVKLQQQVQSLLQSQDQRNSLKVSKEHQVQTAEQMPLRNDRHDQNYRGQYNTFFENSPFASENGEKIKTQSLLGLPLRFDNAFVPGVLSSGAPEEFQRMHSWENDTRFAEFAGIKATPEFPAFSLQHLPQPQTQMHQTTHQQPPQQPQVQQFQHIQQPRQPQQQQHQKIPQQQQHRQQQPPIIKLSPWLDTIPRQQPRESLENQQMSYYFDYEHKITDGCDSKVPTCTPPFLRDQSIKREISDAPADIAQDIRGALRCADTVEKLKTAIEQATLANLQYEASLGQRKLQKFLNVQCTHGTNTRLQQSVNEECSEHWVII